MSKNQRPLLPLVCVIGWPVGHSLSPHVHGYWLSHHRLAGNYIQLPVEPDDLKKVLEALPKCGFVGANITIPHKEAVFRLADKVSATAQRLKAANTLYFHDGMIEADNTDGFGFIENVRHAVPDYDFMRSALILGAGGASRAIIDGLLHEGTNKIYLCNRTKDRAQKIVSDFNAPPSLEVIDWDQKEQVAYATGLIVNTTSLGMKDENPLIFDFQGAPKDCVVTDIVYTPLETAFLRQAKQQGLVTVDGLGMLLHQARPGFRRWFGKDPVVNADLRARVLSL